jgi:hypothetical protein
MTFAQYIELKQDVYSLRECHADISRHLSDLRLNNESMMRVLSAATERVRVTPSSYVPGSALTALDEHPRG